MLHSVQQLALLLSTDKANLNCTTNQLEMQEYLLLSVNRALSAFENDAVICKTKFNLSNFYFY